MVGGRHPLGLAVLGHDVADVELEGLGAAHRLGDPVHQQVGDHAGVEAPRPQQDELGLPDGLHRRGQGGGPLGQEPDAADAAVLLLLKLKDLGLPHHGGAVLKGGLQPHVLIGHREDAPRDGQHLAHAGHRLIEGWVDPVEGSQDEVPEGLPGQPPRAAGKSVAEQLLHHRLGVGQGLHAVTDIPRGRHAQILPQHPRPAAVVGHGDDGCEISGVQLQAPQHGGQPRPTADGHDPGAAAAFTAITFCHVRFLRAEWVGHGPYARVMSRWFSLAS